MKKDVYDDPQVKAFLNQFAKDGLPAIIDSAMMMVIADEKPDPKLCIEIGAAILLDKPIVVCLPEGRTISEHLRKCALRIIPIGPDGQLTEAAKGEIEDVIYATGVRSHLGSEPLSTS